MNKKEFIERLIDMGGCGAKPETWARGWDDAIGEVLGIAEELDEPETLSQEWIDENKVARINNVRKMTTSDVVTVEKLKYLLVPKQDKPVIPQFVADYIEQSKKDNDSINQVFAFIDDKEDKDLWHWLFPSMYEEKRANQEVFMRAWLDGYEVEKEPRWVIAKGGNYIKTYLIDSNKVVNIDYEPEKEGSLTFLSREEAEAVASLVIGEVKEVTE